MRSSQESTDFEIQEGLRFPGERKFAEIDKRLRPS